MPALGPPDGPRWPGHSEDAGGVCLEDRRSSPFLSRPAHNGGHARPERARTRRGVIAARFHGSCLVGLAAPLEEEHDAPERSFAGRRDVAGSRPDAGLPSPRPRAGGLLPHKPGHRPAGTDRGVAGPRPRPALRQAGRAHYVVVPTQGRGGPCTGGDRIRATSTAIHRVAAGETGLSHALEGLALPDQIHACGSGDRSNRRTCPRRRSMSSCYRCSSTACTTLTNAASPTVPPSRAVVLGTAR
ncbi:hypothetical protein SUDANB150_07754 [Streptomyces sp. enrichment culture]